MSQRDLATPRHPVEEFKLSLDDFSISPLEVSYSLPLSSTFQSCHSRLQSQGFTSHLTTNKPFRGRSSQPIYAGLFFSDIYQEISWEERRRNVVFCVEWGVKI